MSITTADCRSLLPSLDQHSVDLVYIDPPFYSGKTHHLKSRDGKNHYSFSDNWGSLNEYREFMHVVITECRRCLKSTGSIFLHCDKSSAHHLRLLLDEIFGADHFQSEIIWTYRRWSNSKMGLLPAHQNIYFYSKSKDFKFNKLLQDYSPTTNIDQILQLRTRNELGKSAYAKDEKGNVLFSGPKKGVPLSDVWHIPYLNPKAKERVGFPTQKPIILLERIINIATNENDVVLDPMCGSGTTLVTAKLNNRQYIGADIDVDAVKLTNTRLEELVRTRSFLLEKGIEAYVEQKPKEMAILTSIGATPVQRNKSIDGIMPGENSGQSIPIRIQRKGEQIEDLARAISKAAEKRSASMSIVIRTQLETGELFFTDMTNDVVVIDSLDLSIQNYLTGKSTP